MRTKTLLLTAALSAAGIATASAQVYSVNAVGYVNITVPAGQFAMISNPLDAEDNTIKALFADVPVGTTIYYYNGQTYLSAQKDLFSNTIIGQAADIELSPGNGVFVRNGANPAQDFTITFVGEVPQGEPLQNELPQGLSIKGSQVPQAGTAQDLEIPGQSGDVIYQWSTANQSYTTRQFDLFANDWPNFTVGVGEAFFIKKAQAGTWSRDFNVNSQ